MNTDCLKGLFKKTIESKKFSCTVPWIQSMLGITNYSGIADNMPTCSTYDEYNPLNMIGHNFSQEASTYSHPECPGNCQQFI